MIQPTQKARAAHIHLDGWEGRTRQAVLVIGETATRYRIKATQKTKLAGRSRWLESGETSLVPKHAITFDEARKSDSESKP